MSSFHSSTHSFQSTLLEPVHSFFNMSKGAGISFAGVGTFLEAAQSICYNGQENFMCNAIYPYPLFRDRTVLEKYIEIVLPFDSTRISTNIKSINIIAFWIRFSSGNVFIIFFFPCRIYPFYECPLLMFPSQLKRPFL